MSVHGWIEAELRKMGYTTAQAKAIIGIAKAAESCARARRWWSADLQGFSSVNLQVLWEAVRKLAARYYLAFLMPRELMTPEAVELERRFLAGAVPPTVQQLQAGELWRFAS